MSNWWLQWAERIALVLAEWWMRSKSGSGGGEVPDAAPPAPPAEPDRDTPPVPDADTRPQ